MNRYSTGQAAEVIGASEPRLSDLVRRGKIQPPPALFAGRRCWEPDHIRQAATHLGLLTDDLERELQGEACHAR